MVPFEDYPQSRSPDQGFLVTANNDPGGLTFDGSLTDDPWYIGGPWMEGFRAEEITEELAERTADGQATLDDMKEVQANHTSLIAKLIADELLDGVEAARAYAADSDLAQDTPEARVRDLYVADQERLDEAYDRVSAWQARGWPAASGVDTFYDAPTPDDRADAVATSIFNAWMGKYTDHTVGDEGIPGLGWPTGDTGRFRLLPHARWPRRDQPAPHGLVDRDRGPSPTFGTPELETSVEVSLISLVQGLISCRRAHRSRHGRLWHRRHGRVALGTAPLGAVR